MIFHINKLREQQILGAFVTLTNLSLSDFFLAAWRTPTHAPTLNLLRAGQGTGVCLNVWWIEEMSDELERDPIGWVSLSEINMFELETFYGFRFQLRLQLRSCDHPWLLYSYHTTERIVYCTFLFLSFSFVCLWLCVLKQKSFLIMNTNSEQAKGLYYSYVLKYVYTHDKQSRWQVDQSNVYSPWALIPLSVFCVSTNGSFDPWLFFSRTLQHTRLTPLLWSVWRGITRENCCIQHTRRAPASSETPEWGCWPLLLLLSDGATCGVVKLTQLSVFLCFFFLFFLDHLRLSISERNWRSLHKNSSRRQWEFQPHLIENVDVYCGIWIRF